ncbi:MAG: DUF5337 family protein [Albidovulum sp.]
MAAPKDKDQSLAREARGVAMTIAITMVLWIGAQWLGRREGWDASYAFIFDLAALAAFFWALVVTWRIWQRQKRPEGNED